MTSAALRPVRAVVSIERRMIAVLLGLTLAFAALALQLVWLAVKGKTQVHLSMNEPIARTFARPDIVDRNGRLIATDLDAPSLYADPALILDIDEASEKLGGIFPDLDQVQLRLLLADKGRRFVWIRRGLSPRVAQRVHDLGLPGLAFRREPRRSYPMGKTAGHVLGGVNVDNRGLAGIEKYIDEIVGVEAVLGSKPSSKVPVQLSLDLGAQHALEDELAAAVKRYTAQGAAGIVMDAHTGEIIAAASLPDVDPARPQQAQDPARLDKNTTGVYELGSIFKLITVAQALDSRDASLESIYDVRAPLRIGRHQIRDLHPAGRPLSLRDVFVLSSNVGAAQIALKAGAAAQQEFMGRIGLLKAARSEAGPTAPPSLPVRWGEIETATIGFGHGLAVSPLRFVAAAASLLNGGYAVEPTVLRVGQPKPEQRTRVVAPETSAALGLLMRRNVTAPNGTGRRAEVSGFEVGGKTGTAEIAIAGKYQGNAVISSFLATFPASHPRYVVLVMLHQPQPSAETSGQITAGLNAAPTAAKVIARIAPLTNISPIDARTQFDALHGAK